MSRLTIQSDASMGPLEVTVYPPDGDPIEFTLSSGATVHAVPAGAGQHVVIARRPNGERLRRVTDLPEGSAPVTVDFVGPGSSREWLHREVQRGEVVAEPAEVDPKQARPELAGLARSSVRRAMLAMGAELAPEAARELALCAWQLDGDRWTSITEVASAGIDGNTQLSDSFLKIKLERRSKSRAIGLLDGDSFGPVVMVPPFAEAIEVTFLAEAIAARTADRARAPVGQRVPAALATLTNDAAADLLAALAAPDTPRAAAIWNQVAPRLAPDAPDTYVADSAIATLIQKFRRPAEALLAAHYLLRFLPARLPPRWAGNLCRALPQAADGPAIAAWTLILNRPKGMSDALLDSMVVRLADLALSRPATLFARTRLLLSEALRLRADGGLVTEPSRREETFRRFGAGAGGLECFWGSGPDAPGPRAKAAKPAGYAKVRMTGGAFESRL